MKVLDKGFVTLVDYMGGDLTTVNSAKVSFGRRSKEIGAKEQKLINYLGENKHYSPFRHCQLQFHIKMPEFVARQHYKHQVGCAYTSSEQSFIDTPFNEISGRYVELDEAEFYFPEIWRQQSENNKQASEGEIQLGESASKAYNECLNECVSTYKYLRSIGVAREQARMVLPLSFYTEFYWTCSLQAAVNYIKLRDHEGAQWETREYAKAIQALVEQVAPISLKALLK